MHTKSINNFSQWKYKQTFPNRNDKKKSHRGERRGVIVPARLGWLSCGWFIGWRVFVHLFESRFCLLYPGFLDCPKVGRQDVIQMIKVHFHNSIIRVLTFHKFGQFIPAREYLLKVISWNAVTFFLVLIPDSCLCFSASASSLWSSASSSNDSSFLWSSTNSSLSSLFISRPMELPRHTISCTTGSSSNCWKPSNSLGATASGHNDLKAEFKHLTETSFQETTIKETELNC